MAFKNNSLLSVKQGSEEWCPAIQVPQQAHMHTAVQPDTTAPFLKPLHPRRAEERIKLIGQVPHSSLSPKKRN